MSCTRQILLTRRGHIDMTRKLQQSVEEGKGRKRVLKPAVEKKRRDRINRSLSELRSLLLTHMSDPRLQNPKIEKAEILDLAVEHLQRNLSNVSADSTNSHMKTHHTPVFNIIRPSDSITSPLTTSPLITMETAGFQQCVAKLISYMHRFTPAQRTSLIEGLQRHHQQQYPNAHIVEFNPRTPESDETAKGPHGTSMELICTSERREGESPRLSFQPHSCSTPLHLHDYLSPPASPWLSPSFPSHLSFPLPSPPTSSSNTSSSSCFFTFSPPVPACAPLTFPPPVTPCTPLLWSHTHLAVSPTPHTAAMWRPWF